MRKSSLWTFGLLVVGLVLSPLLLNCGFIPVEEDGSGPFTSSSPTPTPTPQFQSASLVLYLCPDFNQGCAVGFFTVDQQCAPLQNAQPGTCYDTGLTVLPDTTYGVAACTDCASNCSNPVGFTTPSGGFDDPTYYPQILFFCQNQCSAPSTCP